MLVGGNLLAMERRHEFRPDEFRLWVALHECTHRLQFTAVPWMRPYFLSLVARLVEASAADRGPGGPSRRGVARRRPSGAAPPRRDRPHGPAGHARSSGSSSTGSRP